MNLTNEQALNVILSHLCPDIVSGNVSHFVMDSHCNLIKIRAELISTDPGNPVKEERYKWKVLDLKIE